MTCPDIFGNPALGTLWHHPLRLLSPKLQRRQVTLLHSLFFI